MLQDSKVQDIVDKWTPIVYFHSEEKYFPCSIEWILQHSTLVDYNDDTKKSPVTNRDLYENAKKYNFQGHNDGDVILSFDKSIYMGQSLSDAPCYAIFRTKDNKNYITYIFLFAYNGEYDILGLTKVGMHPGDIEHITVETNNDNQLLRVFYGAHGSTDGIWIKADDVPLENGKIVAYSALHGHGLYPKIGTVIRLYGLSNDYTDNGIKWTPKASIIYDKDNSSFNIDTMGWSVYYGRIGGSQEKGDTSGITGLADKGWFKNIDELDETYYSPPPLVSPNMSMFLKMVYNIFTFIALYILVYLLLIFVDRFIMDGKYISCDDTCRFKVTDHVITVIIVLVSMFSVSKLTKFIINKVAPT